MNNKILNLLGVVGVTVGMTTVTTAAQASTLGPGRINFTSEAGILFNNNAIATINDPAGSGNSRVTTPANFLDPEAMVFGIIPGNSSTYPDLDNIDEVLDKLDSRQFVVRNSSDPALNANVLTNDFAFTAAEIAALNNASLGASGAPCPETGSTNKLCNNVMYDLTFGNTFDVTTEPAFLEFDTDGDGLFGEASGGPDDPGDFKYYVTKFTRIVDDRGDGAFEVSFDFEGFFVDMEGNFKNTPSIVSLFTGVTGFNPELLDVVDPIPLDDPAFSGSAYEASLIFQAGVNGAIETEGRQAPEPGTIIGLTALAGLGLGTRLKRKVK